MIELKDEFRITITLINGKKIRPKVISWEVDINKRTVLCTFKKALDCPYERGYALFTNVEHLRTHDNAWRVVK